MIEHLSSYESLANAIILQAVKDYRGANARLKKNKKNLEASRMKSEVLRFFRSRWFSVLTSLDPEMLIQKLEEEVTE